MFLRTLTKTLLEYTQFPAIVVHGPRQSGKTTLVRSTFNRHVYTSFEDPDTRALAINDPKNFLQMHENSHGIIIDEFQYVPHILSYLQLEIDEKNRPGYFILTGSQNFLMLESITQSLAGRVGILTLPPLSLNELEINNILPTNVDEVIFNGGYPRLYEKKLDPLKLYPSYINTYLERDVRQVTNVGDLGMFQKFLALCAGRVGQQLNLSEIAGVCGISSPTAQKWLSVLEASFIVFQLQPYYKNYNKRLTKSSKLYFYDTGVVCSLLGIESSKVLMNHPFKGGIFECFIIADLCKQYLNIGRRPPLYYWRDLNGRLEVDCIIESNSKLYPVEIKSGLTVSSEYFSAITAWNKLSEATAKDSYIIYGGDLVQQRSTGNLMGWRAASNLIEKIRN